jgi:hypothetical protein
MLKARALALICVAGGEGACFVRQRKLKVLDVPTATVYGKAAQLQAGGYKKMSYILATNSALVSRYLVFETKCGGGGGVTG